MNTANSHAAERRNLRTALCFLAPNLLGFLAFTAFPVGLSLFMSFTNWDLKPGAELEWVGLRNYTDLLGSSKFWFYFYNTFYFMLGIPISVFLSLLLANMLVDPMRIGRAGLRRALAAVIVAAGRLTCVPLFLAGSRDTALLLGLFYAAGFFGVLFGSSTFRTMFYIPNFAAGVATIILWMQIFNPHTGMANEWLGSLFEVLGIDAELPTWLVSTRNLLGFLPLPESFNNGGFGFGAREAIIIMGIWSGIGGNNMILYIAAIANIPDNLYEAAAIDGAGPLARFRHVTVPSVAPTTFFIVIMSIIGGLQGGFETARVMTQGGPAGITTTLSYYIYSTGFEELKLGYSAAVSWILFLVVFVATLVYWRKGNRQMESL